MRIVSLLPAATEILGVLGLMDQVVGVSHECDFPAEARHKPRVTSCAVHGSELPSADIDRWVSAQVGQGIDLFTLDEPLMRSLRPDLILTQKLCDVCAPAYGSVAALAQTLPGPPRVVNLEPACLDDILHNIEEVARITGAESRGQQVLASLRARIEFVRTKIAETTERPRVAVVEWLDPVFCSGHWTPELVSLAGGQEVLGQAGKDSTRKTWAEVRAAEPEILVIACCGQSSDRAFHDWQPLQTHPDIRAVAAVRANRVFFADGNAYFSRPGPRVLDTLEILATILHPEIFRDLYAICGVRRN